MSITDSAPRIASHAGAGRLARIINVLRHAQELRAQRVIYRQTVRALRSLSDRELEDLGLTRGGIEDAARTAMR